MICRPLAGGKCEVFQILDGDLKGNVPAAVRSFSAQIFYILALHVLIVYCGAVLNKMLPGTTAALDSKVKALPMIDRPLRRAAAASGAAHSSDLGERIDSVRAFYDYAVVHCYSHAAVAAERGAQPLGEALASDVCVKFADKSARRFAVGDALHAWCYLPYRSFAFLCSSAKVDKGRMPCFVFVSKVLLCFRRRVERWSPQHV